MAFRRGGWRHCNISRHCRSILCGRCLEKGHPWTSWINYEVQRNLAIEFQQSVKKVLKKLNTTSVVQLGLGTLNIYDTMNNRMHQVRREVKFFWLDHINLVWASALCWNCQNVNFIKNYFRILWGAFNCAECRRVSGMRKEDHFLASPTRSSKALEVLKIVLQMISSVLMLGAIFVTSEF